MIMILPGSTSLTGGSNSFVLLILRIGADGSEQESRMHLKIVSIKITMTFQKKTLQTNSVKGCVARKISISNYGLPLCTLQIHQ